MRRKGRERESKVQGGRQSLHALVQDGVSMVTSAGYQKIEAPTVCLHSTLPQPLNTIYLLQHIIAYLAICQFCHVSVVFASKQKNVFKNSTHADRETDRQRDRDRG